MLLRALLLILLAAAVCWPTWGAIDLDGTEGRRVQIALEMLRSGDWLVPTLGFEPTWAKPPLHYWLLAACIAAFGDSVWSVRLPSVVGLALSAWLAGELLRVRFGARAGAIGAVAVVCAPLAAMVWATAEIDPLFASFTAASLWCLGLGAGERRRSLLVASGVLAGMALLQKGPPYFLFAAGAYVVWWRERRLWGLAAHVAPMLVVALGYYVPLWTLRVAPGEMLAVVNEESVGRVWTFQWHHVKDTPEYWLRALAMTLPFAAWWRWREAGAQLSRANGIRGGDPAGGAVALRACRWAVGVAIVALTFFPGRPTRYLLPNVPLLAFAFAPAMAAFAAEPALPRLARALLRVVGVAGAVALLALPFAPRAGAAALGLAAAAGLVPLLARTPRAAIVACLALPVVAAWTVGFDRAQQGELSRRARTAPAAVLRRELDALGVDPAELQTVGHFDSPLLLAAGLLPPGDELGRREWRARWVLRELGGFPVIEMPPEYRLRLRLDLPFKSFALCERTGPPKLAACCSCGCRRWATSCRGWGRRRHCGACGRAGR